MKKLIKKTLSLIWVFGLSSCVYFSARSVNPEVDLKTNSTDYREKYDYIESREKSGQPTSVVLNPFEKKEAKLDKAKRQLEVKLFCDAKDEKLPVSSLVRGKEVAWFLRRKTGSPRDLAMTDQDGMIYIPFIAEPTDEVIVTYGKFTSKAVKVGSQNPVEIHLSCY